MLSLASLSGFSISSDMKTQKQRDIEYSICMGREGEWIEAH